MKTNNTPAKVEEVKVVKVDQEVTTPKINKSKMIRTLHDEGKTIKEIASTVGIRYQFARNVVEIYKLQKNQK